MGALPSNSKLHLVEFGPACGKNPLEKHSSYCTDTAAVFPNETQYFICFNAVLSQINLAHDSLRISFARFDFCVWSLGW